MPGPFPHLHAVMVCGQSGNELWPLVRAKNPRETIVLPEESESLLETAVRRAREVSQHPILFTCPSAMEEQLRRCIDSCHLEEHADYRILHMPCEQGSAYAMAFAAAVLRSEDSNACMLVMEPQTRLEGDDRWEQAVARATKAADEDKIAVFAVDSRRSASRHSFLRTGGEVPGLPGVEVVTAYAVDATQQQANRYVSLGLPWSVPVTVVKAGTVMASLRYVSRHSSLPSCRDMDRVAETATFMASIDEGRWLDGSARKVVESLPARSFEEAVVQSLRDVVAIPTSMECATMETLRDIDDIQPPDEDGNRIVGRGFAVDSRNTTIYDSDRLTVALGCEDIMVVNTRDAVLVASKDALDSLGTVIPQLVEAGAREALDSSIVSYGWGFSNTVFSGKSCKTVMYTLQPGKSMGRYSRMRATENWTVLDGAVVCVSSGNYKSYRAGETFSFAPGAVHELKNMSGSPVTLICVEHTEA